MNIINNGLLFDDDDDFDDARIPRQIYERANYFNNFEDVEFCQRFRTTTPTALLILDLIQDEIEFPFDM